jgi:hypothetical protein
MRFIFCRGRGIYYRDEFLFCFYLHSLYVLLKKSFIGKECSFRIYFSRHNIWNLLYVYYNLRHC